MIQKTQPTKLYTSGKTNNKTAKWVRPLHPLHPLHPWRPVHIQKWVRYSTATRITTVPFHVSFCFCGFFWGGWTRNIVSNFPTFPLLLHLPERRTEWKQIYNDRLELFYCLSASPALFHICCEIRDFACITDFHFSEFHLLFRGFSWFDNSFDLCCSLLSFSNLILIFCCLPCAC